MAYLQIDNIQQTLEFEAASTESQLYVRAVRPVHNLYHTLTSGKIIFIFTTPSIKHKTFFDRLTSFIYYLLCEVLNFKIFCTRASLKTRYL